MSLVDSSLRMVVAKLSGYVVSLVGYFIFARELGTAGLGSFFLFQSVVIISSVPANFGLNKALIKRMSEGTPSGRIVSSVYLIKTISLSFVLSIIFLFENQISSFIGIEVGIYIFIAIPLREYSLTANHALSGENYPDKAEIIRSIGILVWGIFGYIFIFQGYQSLGLVLAFLTQYLAVFILSAGNLETLPTLPTKDSFRSVIKYAKFSAVSSTGALAYNWADTVLIGFFLTPAAVGAYEIAWRISGVFSLLGSSLGTVLFPQISLWHSEENYTQIGKAVSQSILPATGLVIPGIAGAIFLGEPLLRILYGPEFIIATLSLIILISDKAFNAVYAIFRHSLGAIDRPDLSAKWRLVGISVNLVMNVALILRFGITGAAVATLTSTVVEMSLYYRSLSSRIAIQIPYLSLLWCTISALIMYGTLTISTKVINISSISELVLVIIFGGVVYLLTIWLSPSIRYSTHTLFREFE